MLLDWRYVPGRGAYHPKPLIRAYCERCEQHSRAIRTPNASDRNPAWGPTDHPLVFPDPPRGWENGCPRCDR